ncbi:MAG: HAD family hydrolase [Deltaproteobacteria bacterium]|nr:HAD family hydrolase [Deltaproteobacteria bacterium]
MNQIKAIGFDLFNTLITADPGALSEAMQRLTTSLEESGFQFEAEPFRKAYREAAIRFVTESKANGRETHNRFWISEALISLGQKVTPGDPSIAKAVEAYFSAFFDYCRLIPKTLEMLEQLQGRYRLGLLSNFTHAPAVEGLLDQFGLAPFFETILVSGEIGYRKPHPLVFEMLVNNLGFESYQILYVGDSLDPDVLGATQSGLRPVWMTYVRDNRLPSIPVPPSESDGILSQGVPRVSDWEAFLSLLQQS